MCFDSLLYKCLDTGKVAGGSAWRRRSQTCVWAGAGYEDTSMQPAGYLFTLTRIALVQTDTKLGSGPGHMLLSRVCLFAEMFDRFY